MSCESCSVRNELDLWRVISKVDWFPMHFTQQARGTSFFFDGTDDHSKEQKMEPIGCISSID